MFSPGKVGREGRKNSQTYGLRELCAYGGRGSERRGRTGPKRLLPSSCFQFREAAQITIVVIGNPEGRVLHTEFWKEDSSPDSEKFSDFGKATGYPWVWFSNLQNEEFGLNWFFSKYVLHSFIHSFISFVFKKFRKT